MKLGNTHTHTHTHTHTPHTHTHTHSHTHTHTCALFCCLSSYVSFQFHVQTTVIVSGLFCLSILFYLLFSSFLCSFLAFSCLFPEPFILFCFVVLFFLFGKISESLILSFFHFFSFYILAVQFLNCALNVKTCYLSVYPIFFLFPFS